MALEPITRKEKIVAGKDLKPITRMEKFLKKYGGGGGNSAPADWNAKEGEPGHILNRPFYDGIFVDRVVAKRGLKLTEYEGISGFMMPDVVTVFTGEKYTVNYNGMDVNCTCMDTEFMGLPMQAMGNLAAMNGVGNTGEPFVLLVVPAEYVELIGFGVGIVPLDGSTTLNVSVRGLTPAVKTIPYKYLPSYTIVLTEDDEADMSDGAMIYTSAANYDDFAELVYNGVNVWVDCTVPLNVVSSTKTWTCCKVNGWMWNESTKVFSVMFEYLLGVCTVSFPNGTWTPPGYVPSEPEE